MKLVKMVPRVPTVRTVVQWNGIIAELPPEILEHRHNILGHVAETGICINMKTPLQQAAVIDGILFLDTSFGCQRVAVGDYIWIAPKVCKGKYRLVSVSKKEIETNWVEQL